MLIAENVPDRRGRADRRGGGKRDEELTAAMEHGQVKILYQPQFACVDNALVGAEALSRWDHPRLGRIGIDALFDIAARCGRTAELTSHIAVRALAAATYWPEFLRLSLNISAADLADESFANTVLAALAVTGFAPGRLTLEITEQTLVSELDRSGRQLERLARRGIRIALDDFGAGFCNFHYLKRLPLEVLKLDRSMVHGVVEDERDLAILRAILAMARALDLRVVAEGVENEDQLVVVVREGCEKWQGFLGGAPMTVQEFAVLAAG
jgi:EAL domain-containing protein (putative c-di-GMP-specific phosphodiesterase class I)